MKTRIRPVLITFALACFALVQTTRAVTPAPDGGYPHFTTAEGDAALNALTSGLANTAVGWFSLSHATTGSYNTGVGAGTLDLNNGNENTATGVAALLLNTTGANNTANGAFALAYNTTGGDNTALGDRALQSNTTGFQNTANGYQALLNNTTGFDHTANGYQALFSNTIGVNNVATGWQALFRNTTGSSNTASGANALVFNTTGNQNTAIGLAALANNTTGSNNIALGFGAGGNLTTGDYNIDIGNAGMAGQGNTIRIGSDQQGATYIAGIYGVSVSGLTVAMDSSNRLGTVASSRRFKEKIRPMDNASEAILALEPVTFRYKKEIDPAGTSQFGLVAEEVEKVNPDLVVRDKDGKPYSVRYDAVNAMLLNEFLKEHRKVQELEKQVEKLTAGLQKVSAQIEMSNPAAQMAANRR